MRTSLRPRRAWLVVVLLTAIGGGAAPAKADPVTVGRSGWFWGTPLPQGENLADVSFSGSTGYAVGSGGTLLRSADGGATWTGLRGGRGIDFRHVDAISPDTFVAASGCELRLSTDAGATLTSLRWTSNERRCPTGITDLSFPTATVGYLLLGDGSVLRTADGGDTWARVGDPIDGAHTIAFRDAQTGLVAWWGGIKRTTDGGRTWTGTFSALTSPAGVNAARFAVSGVAYANGGATGFLRSDDDGASWSPTAAVSSVPFPGSVLACGDASTCITGPGPFLMRTADSGATFAPIQASSWNNAAAFSSPSRAVTVGPAGFTAISTDAGATLSRVGSRLGAAFSAIRRISSTEALMLGNGGGRVRNAGALARTIDGGRSWTDVGAPTTETIVDAAFPNSSSGYLLDASGTVLRTANGGLSWSWVASDPGEQPGAAAIATTDMRHLVLVGPVGIRRSADEGNTISEVTQGIVRRARLTHAQLAGRTLLAWGTRAIVMSRDGGRVWSAVRRPGSGRLRHVDFTGSRNGWALDDTGRLWRTTDGGRRWSESVALGTARGIAVDFASPASGWVLLASAKDDPGSVMRTTNGGASWRHQIVSPSRLSGLAALSAGAAVAIGPIPDLGANAAFGTASGGDAPGASAVTLGARLPRRGLTRRALRARRGRVEVTGRLRGGGKAATVRILTRGARGGTWVARNVTVRAGGRFSLTLRVSRSTVAVARYAGDDYTAEAGSRALTIRVR